MTTTTESGPAARPEPPEAPAAVRQPGWCCIECGYPRDASTGMAVCPECGGHRWHDPPASLAASWARLQGAGLPTAILLGEAVRAMVAGVPITQSGGVAIVPFGAVSAVVLLVIASVTRRRGAWAATAVMAVTALGHAAAMRNGVDPWPLPPLLTIGAGFLFAAIIAVRAIRPRRRGRPPMIAVLAGALLVAWSAPALGEAAALWSVRRTATRLVGDIEAHRSKFGAAPRTLDELVDVRRPSPERIRYRPDPAGFTGAAYRIDVRSWSGRPWRQAWIDGAGWRRDELPFD